MERPASRASRYCVIPRSSRAVTRIFPNGHGEGEDFLHIFFQAHQPIHFVQQVTGRNAKPPSKTNDHPGFGNKIYDTYSVGFNSYLFLRKSCYECKYVGTNRISDITIADYWGVPKNEISEKEKKYGVSLILVNSLKGNSLIEKMNNDMVIKEIESDNAIEYNQA